MPFPVFTAGQRLKAVDLTNMQPQSVRKAADATPRVNNTLANDPDITLPVSANAIYQMTALIVYGADSAADLKYGWSAPAGSTLDWEALGQLDTNTGQSGTTWWGKQTISTTSVGGGASAGNNTTIMTALASGLLVTGGSAGNLVLQWAQNTTTPATGTIVKAGSYLILFRMA